MKTFKDLKEAITRIQSIDQEGLLRKFARDQALINIELIKPYTDKYDLIVRCLVTGKDAAAAAEAAYAAVAVAAADTPDTPAVAAAYAAADAAYAAATYDYVDAYAAYGAAAYSDASYTGDYTNAIESLNTLAKEHKL